MNIFQEIEESPEEIIKYIGVAQPQNKGNQLKNLESKVIRIRAKIDRLTETLADAEGSSAAKYILKQIEKEDLNLEAVKREIEIAKADARKIQKEQKSAEARISEITCLIHGLDTFSAADKNKIVREVVQECTWDGETLFLRL